MITAQLEQMLQECSCQSEVLLPNVLRVYRKRSDKPYAMYLFDCTENVTAEGFDIRKYQEEWIRQEFYRISGSLQWNIYCYLLCGDDAIARIQERINGIESDTAYARKLVRTIGDARRDLIPGSEHLVQASAKNAPPEISVRWEQLLTHHRLEVVSSALGYRETVKQILSSEQGEDVAPVIQYLKEDKITDCREIAKLKLQGFRLRPCQREFEFGNCNLIFGVNGTGKTSLLEAIELWLCGRNLRNEGDQPRTDCISIMQQGIPGWITGPESRPTIYRERDLAWYGNYEARKNVLCRSFGRFNFFNSDAAARLELAPDEESTDQLIAKMILGDAGARLAEKMEKVLVLLQKEHSHYSHLVSQAEASIRANQATAATMTRPGEYQEKNYLEVSLRLKGLGLKKEPTKDDDSIVSVSHAIQAGIAPLQNLIDSTHWLPTLSESRVKDTLSSLNSSIERAAALDASLKEILEKGIEIRKKIDDCKFNISILRRYQQYVQANALYLANGHQRLNDLRARRQLLENAVKIIKAIDLSEIQVTGITLQQAFRKAEEYHQLNSEKTSKLQDNMHLLEIRHGHFVSLLADVRTKVREILESDSKAHSCPVCGTSFPRAELLLRIDNAATDSTTGELEQTRVALTEAQETDRASALAFQRMQVLKSMVLSLGQENLSQNSPLSEVTACARSLPSSLSDTEAELSALEENYRMLNTKGFNEEELNELEERASFVCENQLPVMPKMLSDAIARLNKELLDSEQTEKETQKHKNDIEGQKVKVLKICEGIGVSCVQLPFLISRLELSLEALCKLREVFALGEEDDLRNFMVQLRTAAEMLQNHLRIGEQDAKMEQLMVVNAAQIKQAQCEVNNNRPILERIRQAVNVIEDIRTNYSAAEYQRSVLDSNRNDISEIFRRIHAPQEFERVVPNESGVSLMLERRKSKELCGVSKISSGQRTALCLAIFLALNQRAIKAPPVVLLDDPVAHADDLNVLSFLDYLRDLVSGSNRQIFFATANSKVAGLFKKKFDFMRETEFRTYELMV